MKQLFFILNRFMLSLAVAMAATPLSLLATETLTLTCPQEVVVVTAANECEVQVFFDTLSFEHDQPLIDTVFLPESGSFFPTGTTAVVLATTDIHGNIETCTFHVTVLGLNSSAPVCLPQVDADLQNTCERLLEPAEILDMTQNGCAADFLVYRYDENGDTIPGLIDAFDVLSTLPVLVVNQLSGASCSSQVTVTGGAAPPFTCPPDLTIYCNEPTDSSHTGVPALTGCYQQITLVYSDDVTTTNCPDSIAFQIIRTWVSTDPFGFHDTCHQMITAMRFELDSVVFPTDFDGLENPILLCNDSLTPTQVADPAITGVPLFQGFPLVSPPSCKVVVSFEDLETSVCGSAETIERVWKVVKVCPPTLTLLDTQLVVVADTVAPLFDLPDTLHISLAPECTDTFYFPSVNILAECSPYSVEIITPWDTLYTNGGMTHVDSVEGVFPVYYSFVDECGNASSDTNYLKLDQQVLVRCPADTTINCDEYLSGVLPFIQTGNVQELNGLGYPEFAANCEPDVSQNFNVDLNFCSVGTVTRTFTTTNTDPVLTCTQLIHVTHLSDYEVIFPADTAVCTGTLSQLPQPQIVNLSCEQIAFNFQDNITPGNLPGCYSVERNWQIQNNCIYVGLNQNDDIQKGPRHFADGGDGVVTYSQVIEVNNGATPLFPMGCEINDKVLPVNNCSIEVVWPEPAVTVCRKLTGLSISGVAGAEPGGSSFLPPGSYQITYTATDTCGNTGTCSTQFTISDETPPVIKCKPVVVSLENAPTPFAEVLASDFDDGSFDNCTDSLWFSFSPDTADFNQFYFCCEEGQYSVEIWATDSVGNQSFCNQQLTVLPGNANCNCGADIAGVIATEANLTVGAVVVSLTDAQGNTLEQDTTAANGAYAFTGVAEGEDYGIVPYKHADLTNGVTTFDMVLITRHILGVAPLNSPYKIIAADVNKSGTVTTFDLVGLQKVILNVTNSFPNGNTSWRFIPAAYNFPNPSNPFEPPFPELIQLTNITGNRLEEDFIAIKVGDVNNSANPQN